MKCVLLPYGVAPCFLKKKVQLFILNNADVCDKLLVPISPHIPTRQGNTASTSVYVEVVESQLQYNNVSDLAHQGLKTRPLSLQFLALNLIRI